MKVKHQDSIKYQVEQRIKKMPEKVVLRDDLADIGDYRQISRALNALVTEQVIARIGKGVYAKMRSSIITGQPVLDGAFTIIAREALDKLEVPWQPEAAEVQYNAGSSMQVPANGRVALNSRFSRRIGWGGMELQYERIAKRA
jgi:hypothetical protein